MQRFSFYRFFICAWWIKRLKFRILESLSLFVVRLHVKGRFPIKYLSFRNKISDFDIYTAIGCECDCCHVRIDSQQNYNLDSFWISSGASFGGICHEGTSGVAQARQHILTFEGSATNSESLLRSTYSCYSRCQKDVHSAATGCKWLTFLLRLWCNVTKVRTSPGSTHFCSYCFRSIHLQQNEITCNCSKMKFVNFFPSVALVCTNFMKTSS